MCNITDLNAQDEFTHSNSIFSKDLMSYDDDDDKDYQVIKYCDDFLVQFDNSKSIIVMKGECKLSNKKYAVLKPCFLFKPKEIIERTLKATTQYGRSILLGPTIHNKFKSPFLANNVIRQHEAAVTDSVKASIPAIDTGGILEAQFYIGRESFIADTFRIKSERQFVNTLEDIIQKRGAMDFLINDSAKVEISIRVQDVLRAYFIKDWQSEPNF